MLLGRKLVLDKLNIELRQADDVILCPFDLPQSDSFVVRTLVRCILQTEVRTTSLCYYDRRPEMISCFWGENLCWIS